MRLGHMDFLEKMGDSKTNLIIYSGHSSVGGNGSQSVDDAPQMMGTPKTVVAFDYRCTVMGGFFYSIEEPL